MAVTHSTAAKNAATDAVTGLVGATGYLTFRTSLGGTIVATLAMSATAFGAASSGTATANAISADTNAAGNASPVAYAAIGSNATTGIIINCQVAASGSDINMTNGLTVAAGDTVSCSSLTYAALAA
jgi:hypothetical protein